VLAHISEAWGRVLAKPEAQQRLRGMGTVPSAAISPADTQALLAREYATYSALVREANIRAEGRT
jgi:tripartite-type tricarboxylate transporter receptor subunit TctC